MRHQHDFVLHKLFNLNRNQCGDPCWSDAFFLDGEGPQL